MGTLSGSQKDTHQGSLRKVSKPLMEKKRRARINVSLEQLKGLLEKNYSQNIRKRKLEKADILELTVKYLKTLQSSVQCNQLYRSAEYQAGFRNCLNGVSQFLLRAEESGNPNHLPVAQDISITLPVGSATHFSTKDSSSPQTNAPHCPLSGNNQSTKHRTMPCNSGPSLHHNQVLMGLNGASSQDVWRPW
ncbi:hypothetical protein GDO86_012565 [Hymenochirus boettgeri]|uniref:Uncharacterized protein n=1 Tax=Hymenochirus boettgeri TaxID=247094 RepID=A0A8T2IRM4_9PIPI|nr:hypothetical protein GDO86_012565 [Hymenochirus boettgeri]